MASGTNNAQKQPAEDSREYEMTDADFRFIAKVLLDEAGISLADSKGPLVYSRLAKRLRKLGISSFKAYCAFLETEDGKEERQNLLSALTTNVTHFFREPHHFETLKNEILPPLMEQAREGRRVRLWSAGCSNGQEPYSIAMTLLSLMPDAANYDIKILATDIDSNVLSQARAGVYNDNVAEAIPAEHKRTFFKQDKSTKTWQVAPQLRSIISFKELNLIRPWPVKGPFDAIFCRNVVIYFEQTTQEPLWEKFASVLAPKAWMFIGHSERITGPAEKSFETVGVTTYRLTQ